MWQNNHFEQSYMMSYLHILISYPNVDKLDLLMAAQKVGESEAEMAVTTVDYSAAMMVYVRAV